MAANEEHAVAVRDRQAHALRRGGRQQAHDFGPSTVFVGRCGVHADAARAVVGEGRAQEKQKTAVEEYEWLSGFGVELVRLPVYGGIERRERDGEVGMKRKYDDGGVS